MSQPQTTPMGSAGDRGRLPSAPTAQDARQPLVCGCCHQLIPAERLHFLLRDRSLVCGRCVSRPELQPHRTIAPLAQQVVAYGSREVIAALLGPARDVSGIAAGITDRSACGDSSPDQAEEQPQQGEPRSPSPAAPAAGRE